MVNKMWKGEQAHTNIGLLIAVGILGVLLIIMLVLYVSMGLFIARLVSVSVELIESEVLIQTKDMPGVDQNEVQTTFDRMRDAIPKRKVNFGKARAAATYAQKARKTGDEWTADEVNTLLRMMNAAMGIKEESKEEPKEE